MGDPFRRGDFLHYRVGVVRRVAHRAIRREVGCYLHNPGTVLAYDHGRAGSFNAAADSGQGDHPVRLIRHPGVLEGAP